jgi:histidinol dehydrogenase
MKTVRGVAEATRVLTEGRGLELKNVPPHILKRTAEVFGSPLTPLQVAELVLDQVRNGGDAAIRELTRKLDGADLHEIEVPQSAIVGAHEQLPRDLVEAMRAAAGRIRRFHEASLTRIRTWTDAEQGYGQLVNPMRKAGAYVPGGTALYPSTVLMTAIPAKVAGVAEVIACTPTRGDALPHPVVMAAAQIADVDRLFRIGGAQAVAAMAYGTETVPAVDIICGPGNIFITAAKKLLFGEVGIDGLYGPTETVVVADETANPTLCAADLLAQAEHDTLARPVLITTSERIAQLVEKEAEARLERLERESIARASMDEQGCIAIVDDLDEALELANTFAPEHMSLMVRDPWAHVDKVRNAGAVFLGEHSHEVLGDYVAGPSHVMPTGGTARFNSGLGVHSFLKISPLVALDDATSGELAKAASLIARAEGLTAHAESAEVRAELP